MNKKEINIRNTGLTNEELQWTINEALDNVIKMIEFEEKIEKPLMPENPGSGPIVTEAVICHLKHLIYIQRLRTEKKYE